MIWAGLDESSGQPEWRWVGGVEDDLRVLLSSSGKHCLTFNKIDLGKCMISIPVWHFVHVC